MALDIEVGKLKVRLKQWESKFFERNNCKPRKNDIAKGPQDIQDAYRKFWKLTRNSTTASATTEKTLAILNAPADAKRVESSQPKTDVWNCELNKTTAIIKPKKQASGCLQKIGQKLKQNIENLQHRSSAESACREETREENDDSKRRHEMRCTLRQQNDLREDDFDLDFNVRINSSAENSGAGRSLSLNPMVGRAIVTPSTPVHSYRGLTKASLLDDNICTDAEFNGDGSGCLKAQTFNISPKCLVNNHQDLSENGQLVLLLSGSAQLVPQEDGMAVKQPTLKDMGRSAEDRNLFTPSAKLVTPSSSSITKFNPSQSCNESQSESTKHESVFDFSDNDDAVYESESSTGKTKRKPTPAARARGTRNAVKDPSFRPKFDRGTVTSGKKLAVKSREQCDAGTIEDAQPSASVAVKDVRRRTRKTPPSAKAETERNDDKESIGEPSSNDDDELPKVVTRKRRRPTKAAGDQGGRPKKVAKMTTSRNPGYAKRSAVAKTSKKKSAPTENFVRINLKKKIFCRGQSKFNYRRYKHDNWRALQDAKRSGHGEHSASTNEAGNSGIVDDGVWDDQGAEEELRAILEANPGSFVENGKAVLTAPPLDPVVVDVPTYAVVEPLFVPTSDGSVPKDILKRAHKSLKRFGYDSFRPGQLESITRVLSGRSTLVLQPTGAGKSLCYLLAAHLYSQRSSCITVVISPLVSLMDDQVSRVPSFLRAESLHTNMTQLRRERVKQAVCDGEVDILFLSPEAVVGGAGSPFGCLPPEMPPIAFVCIDEVHCISSWSHNFRPSYLRVCWVVHEKLKVRCVLGLTATITQAALENVSQHLRLADDPEAVVRASPLPANLHLTVSRDNDEQSLLHLLRTEPFIGCRSIIVYCIRREQTERLAILIRTCLREVRRVGGKDDEEEGEEEEWSAEAYHAGLSAARRRTIQNQFMSGKLRVVTATVAFGMGLNKADVRGVIHHSMPKSVESYVQEIGRAGRDGCRSFCHLFLDVQGNDRRELKRHIYADSVDRSTVAKLFRLVLVSCRCAKLREMESAVLADGATWKCPGHEVAFSVDDTVQSLDIKEEVVDTLLAQMEMHPSRCVEVLNRTYGTCNVFCYGGAEQLLKLAANCPPVTYALAMARRRKRRYVIEAENRIEFPLVEVAAAIGTDSAHLRRQLRKLVWTEEAAAAGGKSRFRKSGIMVEFKDLYFHVRAVGDLPHEQVDALIDHLYAYVCRHEAVQIEHLDSFYSTLHSVSSAHHWSCDSGLSEARSQKLKEIVRCYFDGSQELLPAIKSDCSDTEKILVRASQSLEAVRSSVRNLLSIHHDHSFTGRAVARIFHGIGSPLYPAEVWGRVRQFWRAHLDHDFNEVCRVATEEIVNCKKR